MEPHHDACNDDAETEKKKQGEYLRYELADWSANEAYDPAQRKKERKKEGSS